MGNFPISTLPESAVAADPRGPGPSDLIIWRFFGPTDILFTWEAGEHPRFFLALTFLTTILARWDPCRSQSTHFVQVPASG